MAKYRRLRQDVLTIEYKHLVANLKNTVVTDVKHFSYELATVVSLNLKLTEKFAETHLKI